MRVATFPPVCYSCRSKLCHSAFVRVATLQATPHTRISVTLPQRIRAGCDGTLPAALEAKYQLCHSAFVRVATREWRHFLKLRTLCHSAFVRVATPNMPQKPIWDIALPQRIRAGCDRYLTWIVRIAPNLPQRIRAGCDAAIYRDAERANRFATAHSRGLRQGFFPRVQRAVPLCHSAFVRVATREWRHFLKLRTLCHSAFVRVATLTWRDVFRKRLFATAHSCGLRLHVTFTLCYLLSLPQRIRAGCDALQCDIKAC